MQFNNESSRRHPTRKSANYESSDMTDVFGLFIIVCWAIFVVYWIIAAFSVKRTAHGKGWRRWGWRFPIFVAVLLGVLLNRGEFSRCAGAVLWRRTPAVGAAADLVTLAGLLVLLWARRTLGGNWSFDVVVKENHELVERGPYAYVRHPIYSGFLLMTLGTAVFSGLAASFVIFAIIFSGLWFKSRQEERLLTRYFPDAYPEYRKRVRAFIPSIF
jgi:protein-S-isoprenylcysteine O-methyltransferase Ste14